MKHPYFNQYKFKCAEWNSAELIHEMTKSWQSQIAFLKDEQSFLKELLAENTLHIIKENCLEKVRQLVTKLEDFSREREKIKLLLEDLHNDVEVLINNTSKFPAVKAFEDTHLLLDLRMDSYLDKYQKLKNEIFSTMREVFKKRKENHYLK